MNINAPSFNATSMDAKNKIFCLGLSRTGTTSICAALEVLGYTALHFSMELFIQPEIIAPDLKFTPQLPLNRYWAWERKSILCAFRARFDDQIFEKYTVFGDAPIPLFYKRLDEKFPNSKFIYTFRDEDKWLASMRWMYEEGSVLWRHDLLEDEMKYQIYKCTKFDPSILRDVYRKHHEDVLSYFSQRPDDILLLNLDEARVGFEPVCNFLNLPLPGTPFPAVNESRSVSGIAKLEHKLARNLPVYNFIKKRAAELLRK